MIIQAEMQGSKFDICFRNWRATSALVNFSAALASADRLSTADNRLPAAVCSYDSNLFARSQNRGFGESLRDLNLQ